LRIDIVNPRKFRKKSTQRTVASVEAKKFRMLYNNMPINQIKKLIKAHGSVFLNKYHNFLISLESRLDTIIYRLHFVNSIGQARQYINHGKITVNGRILNKPSYRLKHNDVVSCVFSLRNFFLSNIIRRLLPLRTRELLYYYPLYYEVNYRILSAKVIRPHKRFSDKFIPFFSKKSRDFVKKGFVYFSYKVK
jgi:small subunit ribosomal protein S4